MRHRLAALTTRQVRAGETARAAGNLQEADGAPVCRSVCESRLSSRGVGGKTAAPETLDIAAVASTLSLPVREIRLACWRYLLIAGMLISFWHSFHFPQNHAFAAVTNSNDSVTLSWTVRLQSTDNCP